MADTIVARATRLLRRRFGRTRPLLLTSEGLWDPAHDGMAYPDFGAWCQAHPGQACELWLGASLLAEVVGEDPGGDPALRAPAARAAWARRVLHHYHGEVAALWPVLPWRALGTWGASALRGVTLAELQTQAQAHGVALRAVRPLWPRLLQRLLAQEAPLRRSPAGQAWLVEAAPPGGSPGHLTRVGLAQGRITSVQRRRLQAPWAPGLQRLLDEEPPPAGASTALLWLGPAPESGVPLPIAVSLPPPYREALPPGAGAGPDFYRPQSRPGLLAWSWLGTCAAVLVLAGGEAHEAWALRAQAQALVVPAEASRAVATPVPVDLAAVALRQRLQHPWQAVFLASEVPASGGLHWLALDHRAGSELRLQGLASDHGPVQRVAAVLRQQPAWQQVLVARLEAQPPGPGTSPSTGQAFEIVARLRETAP